MKCFFLFSILIFGLISILAETEEVLEGVVYYVSPTEQLSSCPGNSSCPSGTAVFLRTTHPELKSSLNITTAATVYFVNLTCNNHGGAPECTCMGRMEQIYIGAKARVAFTAAGLS